MACRIFGKDSRILVGNQQKNMFFRLVLIRLCAQFLNNFLNRGKIIRNEQKQKLNPLKITVWESFFFRHFMTDQQETIFFCPKVEVFSIWAKCPISVKNTPNIR
jgi:hypothetical protein